MKKYLLSLMFLTAISMNLQGQNMENKTITYIHDQPTSFKVKFFKKFMGITNVKKTLLNQMVKKKNLVDPAPISKSLTENFDVTIANSNDRKIWTIKPKKNVSDKVIVFVHGGAYINNLLKYHWQFFDELISKTNATLIVPDYPLAPKYSYKEVYSLIMNIYKELLEEVSPENIILMGDSAGGGFVLGFGQQLKIDNTPQPSQIILLSPWLDVSMSNPDILAIDKFDKILSIEGLILAGKAYAKDIGTKDFKVSPIYGDLTGLAEISVFIGTHDVLLSDVRKFKNLMDSKNISINYFEYPEMFHDWILVTNLKEAKFAINQIAVLINKR